MVTLNGCDIRKYDKKSRKCRSCMNNDYCAYEKSKQKSCITLKRMAAPGIGAGDILIDSIRHCGISAADAAEAMSKAMIVFQEANNKVV